MGARFFFALCLKQVFLGTTKFEVGQKIHGDTAPECPQWLWAL